jgi:hypothetical protein
VSANLTKPKGTPSKKAHWSHESTTTPVILRQRSPWQSQGLPTKGSLHFSSFAAWRGAPSPASLESARRQGPAELDAAGLGGQYTRRTVFSPEDYYGLIDPKTADLSEYLDGYLADMADEYDNE